MTVPYTFATATGNIPLSELDVNFANVKAYVYTAGTVVTNAQPNITSVGTLSSLTVSELTTTNDVDVTGQLTINWLDSNAAPLAGPGILASTAGIYDIGQSSTPFRSGYFGGNVYSGNIITVGSGSFTGNVTGNYIFGNGSQLTGISASTYGNANVANYLPTFSGNITAKNISATGNIYSGNTITAGISSSTGNITGGNLITGGTIKNTGLEVVAPNYITITANLQSANLSAITSTNFIVANNTGYTCTVNLPSSPVDGQITKFTVAGNTTVLTPGSGNVNSAYAGSTPVGTGFKYIYNATGNTWFKSI